MRSKLWYISNIIQKLRKNKFIHTKCHTIKNDAIKDSNHFNKSIELLKIYAEKLIFIQIIKQLKINILNRRIKKHDNQRIN
ncbi:Uncharacterised protein [Campylobacter hyointestinalis]|nr:hypothetical protein CDQ68_01430 [Campylobacter hyointestinalis subsp. hyointestinalis]CUU82746.1 Uncharacterised protein [Campylobacter hyointestinalis]PPB66760.1 hypothetical protein CDQ75_04785 [Campylobacter hyointestinalis subsp. hyointestinalis]PPB70806.1 hypothetical protein CDQ77_01440 [Campylobacter hyointestinalis subsp. hyointestinalis]PPB74358.1 hypothetical protein CDQ79_01045 [Campylobacter hyointestinalis subsp. hyointestinalis]